jgi:hypothetical protein
VRFAFLSGYDRRGFPERFRIAPALRKPLNRAALVETVAGLLNGKRRVVRPPLN